jgi:hypothetical protein
MKFVGEQFFLAAAARTFRSRTFSTPTGRYASDETALDLVRVALGYYDLISQ